MKTVLVHYKEVKESHPMIDDEILDASRIVKVEDLLELNDMFTHIIKVDVLLDDPTIKPIKLNDGFVTCGDCNRPKLKGTICSNIEVCKKVIKATNPYLYPNLCTHSFIKTNQYRSICEFCGAVNINSKIDNINLYI